MPRFVTDSRPISALHPITEFYRQEFAKHHRCLQQHRPYFSEDAITDVEAVLARIMAELEHLCSKDNAGELVHAFVFDPSVLVGILLGSAVVFLFSGLAINAVGRAAGAVVMEVRRQFREIPGIMEGTGRPEYGKVVDIVTRDSLRELITPGVLAVFAPIANAPNAATSARPARRSIAAQGTGLKRSSSG